MDFKDQAWFLNQVVRVRTRFDADGTAPGLLENGAEQGRRRDVAKGPRTLDIDILLYDDLILQDPELQIPHPRIPLRRFVLEPLAALAPTKSTRSCRTLSGTCWRNARTTREWSGWKKATSIFSVLPITSESFGRP